MAANRRADRSSTSSGNRVPRSAQLETRCIAVVAFQPSGSSTSHRCAQCLITNDLDETRSQDISLCDVLLYDPRQIAKAGQPATCQKCQRFRSAAGYRKRQAATKAAK